MGVLFFSFLFMQQFHISHQYDQVTSKSMPYMSAHANLNSHLEMQLVMHIVQYFIKVAYHLISK